MAVLSEFGGIVPRLPWHKLPLTGATVAHDVKIRNGTLAPWRERKALASAVTDAVCVHYHGCCPYTFNKCVEMAEYVTDYNRLFFTGHANYPETARTGTDCELTYSRLGVPQPQSAPSVSGGGATGRDAASRSYVYTWVNKFGEEGAPSPASNSITVVDGSGVTVSGITYPDSSYAVVRANIYRTATVYRTGTEQTQEPGTEFLYVGSTTGSSFSDSARDMYLGEAIVTEDYREPPETLRQICYLRGTGVLTGVTTNGVHFCRPFQPHNWPAELDLTLPYNIVHAVTLGNMLFISTDSYPYVISGAPSCEAHQCRNVTEVNTPLPDIACGHVNSAISTPFGMVYVSKDGLVLVSSNAQFQIITSGWFSTDDWVKIRPETARLAYWRGYIICVTDMVSFMLEIDGKIYNDVQAAALTTISDKPVCMAVTQSDELIMLQDDFLWHWNAGSGYRSYIWCSRELGFGGEATPLAVQCRTTGTQLALLSPRDDILYERFIGDSKPHRLKRLGRNRNWRLRLSGKGTTEWVSLGELFNTLEGNVNNGNTL